MMVFSKDAVNGCWKWGGEYSLPIVSTYSYFVIKLSLVYCIYATFHANEGMSP